VSKRLCAGTDALEEVTTMPREWSKTRERQYEHVKESYEDKGVSKKEAERRAAATVNKSRSKKGETKS
jgi:plasmid stabilization system protein ParE